jgi:hypothetical protein
LPRPVKTCKSLLSIVVRSERPSNCSAVLYALAVEAFTGSPVIGVVSCAKASWKTGVTTATLKPRTSSHASKIFEPCFAGVVVKVRKASATSVGMLFYCEALFVVLWAGI